MMNTASVMEISGQNRWNKKRRPVEVFQTEEQHWKNECKQ